MDPTVFN